MNKDENRIGITVLGSSSKGNSIVIHTAEQGIMIDAGFSRKELLKRMATAGIDDYLTLQGIDKLQERDKERISFNKTIASIRLPLLK